MAFVTCTQCSRHIRDFESACPFCGKSRLATALAGDMVEMPSGLSRSALVLAGTLALAACNPAGQGNQQSIVQPYGAPIPPQPPRPIDNMVPTPVYGGPVPVELPVQVQVMDTGVITPSLVHPYGAPIPPHPPRPQVQTQPISQPIAPPVAAYGAPVPVAQDPVRNAPRYGAPPRPDSPHFKDEA